MAETNSVRLGERRLSLARRVKNKLVPAIGLGDASRMLSTMSHAQNLRVRVESGRLAYLNERTGSWAEVESSEVLASRLSGHVEELEIKTPLSSRQMKGLFRVLMKQPIYILGSTLSEYGITVKNSEGKDMKVPVAWRDLHRELVECDTALSFRFEDAHVWGRVGSWSLGLAGALGGCIYCGIQNDHKENPAAALATVGGATAGTILGYIAGVSLYYLAASSAFVVQRVSRMAHFADNYYVAYLAVNQYILNERGEQALNAILTHLFRPIRWREKRESAAVAQEIINNMPYARATQVVQEVVKTPEGRAMLLVSHPETPRAELLTFADNDQVNVRAKALERIKGELTLDEINRLKHLDQPDVVEALLDLDLPYTFFLARLTSPNRIGTGSKKTEALAERAYNKVEAFLTSDEVAAVLSSGPKDSGFVERVIAHPRIRKQDILAAATAWFPLELIEQALELVSDAIQTENLAPLYDAIHARKHDKLTAEEEARSRRTMHVLTTRTSDRLKAQLFAHPRATKALGLHVIKTEKAGPNALAAFDAFGGDFSESEILDLFDSVGGGDIRRNDSSWGRHYYAHYFREGSIEQRVLMHQRFPREKRVEVAASDHNDNARLIAIKTIDRPTPSEIYRIVDGNLNNEAVAVELVKGIIPLTKSHYLRLAGSSIPAVTDAAWIYLGAQALTRDDQLYLAEHAVDPIRLKVVETTQDRDVQMKALLHGSETVQAVAIGSVIDSLSTDEIEHLVLRPATAAHILERILWHPQLTPAACASILSREQIIPRSKKVVDVEERTHTDSEPNYDGYGGITGYSDVEVVDQHEQSHMEYGDLEIQRAMGFLLGRKPEFILAVLRALNGINSSDMGLAVLIGRTEIRRLLG